jgi:DNA adenine methylase
MPQDMQLEQTDALAHESSSNTIKPFKKQLLKWVGNKQKFAHEIVANFPAEIETYYEPFLGSGAVMATLRPPRAIGSDVFKPLIDIWRKLSEDPTGLKEWYATRYAHYRSGAHVERYEDIKAAYNANPNGADFLFLSRACYGGVVRFRKKDGYMSTPCGPHPPMKPETFSKRVDLWAEHLAGARFERADYRDVMKRAKRGDLIYCDPPYAHSQSILYGAQAFVLEELFAAIEDCRSRGVNVVLSIDGTKKSGARHCAIDIPKGLFVREKQVNVGRSMLRRFQMEGRSLEEEVVSDRLLLTY